jgi:hypothetical protein
MAEGKDVYCGIYFKSLNGGKIIKHDPPKHHIRFRCHSEKEAVEIASAWLYARLPWFVTDATEDP